MSFNAINEEIPLASSLQKIALALGKLLPWKWLHGKKNVKGKGRGQQLKRHNKTKQQLFTGY